MTTTSADGGRGRGSTTETVGEHGRPLMTADEVRRMPEGQILAIIGNRRPLLLEAIIYDRPPLAAATTPLGEEIGQDYTPHIGIGSRRSPGRKVAATPPPSPPRFSLDDEEGIATDSSSEGE